jgi:hypothetical protein
MLAKASRVTHSKFIVKLELAFNQSALEGLRLLRTVEQWQGANSSAVIWLFLPRICRTAH